MAASQALALALTPALQLSSYAQPGAGTFTGIENANIRSDVRALPGSIIPTDVVPLPAAEERLSFGENLQLRILQRLPARLYFNGSCESTFRIETNPFQFPKKSTFIKKNFPPPPVFAQLNAFQQNDFFRQLSFINAFDVVFRVLPNVTIGWTLTPRTRVFGNFFMIRDSLMHEVRLNTTIFSVAYGIQQDVPITRRGNLQIECQARELMQQNGTPVFDLLPALTFSYILTPRMVLFANTLLQARGRGYFKPATRELDPFFTFGGLYQRGGWSVSATGTYVQNWREMYGANASIPINNQSWICDFEVARRLFKELSGLQAFVRAEPIWNFGSHNTAGLAGFDYRFFWGLRMAMGKPPLTAALNQIRQQLEETEGEPPPPSAPGTSPGAPRPSAYLMPYEISAIKPQPIHGFICKDTDNLAPVHTIKDEIANVPTKYFFPPQVDETIGYYDDITPIIAGDLEAPVEKNAASSMMSAHPELASNPDIDNEVMDPSVEFADQQLPDSRLVAMLTPDELDIVIPEADGGAATNPDSEDAIVEKAAQKAQAGQDTRRTRKIGKPATKRIAQVPTDTKAKKHLPMVIMPPLPSVNIESDNPLTGTGLDVSRPIMFNVVR
ncbi:MAG: hypothetical protein K2Y22_01265 [Candidatus Obscuribacterales bacterium]|nr:hypothetical protein [Candidatus Obscuribacterales bacterium]